MAMGAMIVVPGQLSTPIRMQTLLGLLVNYQDVQEKAYREIKKVIGSKTPSYKDKANMPYLEAVILESMRYGTNSALGVPHCTSEDTQLNGYLIPRGTLVAANIWSISHDPRYHRLGQFWIPHDYLTLTLLILTNFSS